ncbi:MAG TPA: DUF3488 and transglutaminase-like domain-containing protein, partial [Pyrinomonadaceae bacterium]|nr:DUF3488 and transglutaminase-like domain-containing protein [Pyrinomonadaceae bacterium]
KIQISERIETALMFIIVPAFYVARKYKMFGLGVNETAIAGVLARLILLLTAIKLFQTKTERDWIFLYLMAFFEVLLAAGISISPLFFVSMILYLLVTLCAIIAFEIRKTSRTINQKTNGKFEIQTKNNLNFRLPSTAVLLLLFIIAVAVPLFFALPRVGGAGLGSNQGEYSSITGFSNEVRLGDVGRLKQSDAIVMRARVENVRKKNLNTERWRGIALDKFDGKIWSKSIEQQKIVPIEGNSFRLGFSQNAANIVTQTIYLEPLYAFVLFAMPRPIEVREGNFSKIYQDSNDKKTDDVQFRYNENNSLNFTRSGFDRVIYQVISDVSIPELEKLRDDITVYPENFKRYTEIPEKFDERIKTFTEQITQGKTNRYDKAKAVEQYLQNNLGYTLDLTVSGDEPLADFLFNVKQGHCEYFSSAMAMMLRTQGIATRIVNGFQQGEFNDSAGVFVVKQKDAHSWVEVYFPETKSWVAFDPTPYAGQTNEANYAGTFGSFKKYMEAFETFWIQYFVAFDNQEQRSLFSSVKNGFQDYQSKTSAWLNQIQTKIAEWWKEVRGDKGLQTSAWAILYGLGYLLGTALGVFLLVWLFRRILRLAIWQKIAAWLKRKNEATIIEFYERMQKLLAKKGFTRQPHQTPLEFAFALNMPEAVRITEKYNHVRFGEKKLSDTETNEIENWLKSLED